MLERFNYIGRKSSGNSWPTVGGILLGLFPYVVYIFNILLRYRYGVFTAWHIESSITIR